MAIIFIISENYKFKDQISKHPYIVTKLFSCIITEFFNS